MQFPLSFFDISLWLALNAIILLISSELIPSTYGRTKALLDKRKLRNIAIIMSTLFLITILIRLYETII